MRRFDLLCRLGFWLAVGGILVLALTPVPPSLEPSDKVQHILAFATLTVLARLGYPRVPAWRTGAMLLGFGAAIEVAQSLPVVGRDGSWGDLAADGLAIVVALAVVGAAQALLRGPPMRL